jgi:hypothetical protein
MQDSSRNKIRTAILAGAAGLALTFGTACTDENGVERDGGVGGNGGGAGGGGIIEDDADDTGEGAGGGGG